MNQHTITLFSVLQDASAVMRLRWQRIVGIVITIFLGLSIMYGAVYYLQKLLVDTGVVTHANLPQYQFLTYVLGLILFLCISAIVQILIVTVFLKPGKTLKDECSAARTFIGRFVLLTLIISILFLLANAPVYGALPLILLDIPVLGVLSIVVGIALNIFLAVYFFSAPFLIVEHNMTVMAALRTSIERVRGHEGPVALLLVLLALFVVLLQIISFILSSLGLLGSLLNIIVLGYTIVLSTSYVYTLYTKTAH